MAAGGAPQDLYAAPIDVGGLAVSDRCRANVQWKLTRTNSIRGRGGKFLGDLLINKHSHSGQHSCASCLFC